MNHETNLLKGDTLEHLKTLSDQKFDLTITSPPYNIGKSYEKKTPSMII